MRPATLISLLSAACAAAIIPSVASAQGGATAKVGPSVAEPASELAVRAARLEHGEGVPRDPAQARHLYCSAAKLGYAPAQYALAWMLANGRGGARDDAGASYVFALAAAQGHVQAQAMLRQLSTSPTSPSCLLPELPPPTVLDLPTLQLITYDGKISRLVGKLAPQFNLDPDLVLAIISVESAFNSKAVSPKQAQGLMQLIPETAERFQVRDVFDAEQNVRGGMAYLRWLLAYYKGNVRLVAAAYNAGEKVVDRYGGVPPYPETRDYVKKIANTYQKAVHPYQRGLLSEVSPLASKESQLK